MRRWSARKPTWLLSLLRTIDMMIASFSRPCTDKHKATSSPLHVPLNIAHRICTVLYLAAATTSASAKVLCVVHCLLNPAGCCPLTWKPSTLDISTPWSVSVRSSRNMATCMFKGRKWQPFAICDQNINAHMHARRGLAANAIVSWFAFGTTGERFRARIAYRWVFRWCTNGTFRNRNPRSSSS